MKNSWCDKIKNEMLDQVNSINFIYEKEVLTKTYEFKVKYLINYKKLFNLYLANLDVVAIIRLIITNFGQDIKIKELLKNFFKFIEFINPIQLLDSNAENSTISAFLEEHQDIIKEKINFLMNIELFHEFELDTLKQFKDEFLLLDKQYIEELNEYSKLLYSFLFGLIEFQILKIDVAEVKHQIERLIQKIQTATEKWPKKKIFYERAYKLLLYSRQSNRNSKLIIDMFEKEKIRHPLIDFSQEALKIIINLRNALTDIKVPQIDVDGLIFENILQRRLLITQKFLLLEKFYEIYNENIKEDNIVLIKGNKIPINEFCWCLKFSANLESENINSDKILEIRNYLEENFFKELRITNYKNNEEKHFCDNCIEKNNNNNHK